MKSPLLRRCLSLPLALTAGFTVVLSLTPTPLRAQQDPPSTEQLGREQAELVRKAQRLHDLMRRLLERYSAKKENRAHQVELIEKGLKHLEESGLLKDAADVRSHLDARALAEATRKQGKVIRDLEELLAILLDRRSLENLEAQMAAVARLANDVRELERRQAELQKRTIETARREPNKAENKLLERLRDLARRQRQESQHNLNDVGLQRPSLEHALARIEQLLRAQGQLEAAARRQTATEDGEADKARRAKAFALGELKQQANQQLAGQSRQRSLAGLAKAARNYQQALKQQDTADQRVAADELLRRLEDVTRRLEDNAGHDREESRLRERMQKLREQARNLDTAKAGDQQKTLEDLAKEIAKAAGDASETQRKTNDEELAKLEQAASKAAELLQQHGPKDSPKEDPSTGPRPGSSAESLRRALESLRRAREHGRPEQDRRRMANLSAARRQLAEAQDRHRRENPEPKDRAAAMARETAQVAESLRQSPRPQETEKNAAKDLDTAEERLRQLQQQLDPGRQAEPQAIEQNLAQSRRNLESARDRLQQAMAETNPADQKQADRARAQAAERQNQLRQEAQRLRQDMRQAQQKGDITREQQQAADRQMQRATEQMRRAQQNLQRGRQATAAERQQDAAEQLERARQEMQRNRPLDKAQREKLQDLAKEQRKLEEDILRLARLVEERKNRRAQQALEQAADAAKRAAESMDQGDQEAEQRQQEARDRLEEARKALDKERDRYQDLRQEELLFRMRQELEEFLAKQKPITRQTEEASKMYAQQQRLSRRSRRKLNNLGDQESELSAKAQFLRTALEDEGVLVFSHALKANEQDLAEVASRLGGRRPDPGQLTVVLQKDVERRTQELLDALKREQERREQEERRRREQNQQQDQDEDNQRQRRRLVSVLAELQMLKQMEQDMLRRTKLVERLIRARGDEVSAVDLALLQRLGHRHNEITRIFEQLRAQMEEAMKPPDQEDAGKDTKKKEDGR